MCMICMDCFALGHTGHKCESLEAAGKRKKGEYQAVLARLVAAVGQAKQQQGRLRQSAGACRQQQAGTEAAIRVDFAVAKRALEEREQAMLAQARVAGEANATMVEQDEEGVTPLWMRGQRVRR